MHERARDCRPPGRRPARPPDSRQGTVFAGAFTFRITVVPHVSTLQANFFAIDVKAQKLMITQYHVEVHHPGSRKLDR